MSAYTHDSNQCAIDAPMSYPHFHPQGVAHPYQSQPLQEVNYTQQQGPLHNMYDMSDQQGQLVKMPPPPLLTQNLNMYSISELQSVNAQQQMLTPVSATGPPTASASPSSSGSPFYGSFSDVSLNNGSPFPTSNTSPGAPVSNMNSLGLTHSNSTNIGEADTLLRLREGINANAHDDIKDQDQELEQHQDQDQDLESNDTTDCGSNLRGELKPRGARRRIWTHALEKYLFTPHEIATLGAPHRRTIYLASLEAHIDRLHSQLLNIGLYPIDTNELLQYKGLNCKTAKGMVAGLQHDIASVRMRILEIERAIRKTEEATAHGRGQDPTSTNYNHNHSNHHHTGHGDTAQSYFPTGRKFSLDSSMPPPSFPR